MASDSEHTRRVQQLFVQHGSEVKYFVLSLLPHPGEAEDLVQETFLTVTAKAHDYEDGTNFKSWAFAIARFKVLEYLRGKRREPFALSSETMELLAREAADEESEKSEVLEQKTIRALAECITKLSPKLKQLVELVYRSGIKPGVAAEQIGWKREAAYVGLSRARKELKRCAEGKIGAAL